MGNGTTGPISFRQGHVSDLLTDAKDAEPDKQIFNLSMKPRPRGGVFYVRFREKWTV